MGSLILPISADDERVRAFSTLLTYTMGIHADENILVTAIAGVTLENVFLDVQGDLERVVRRRVRSPDCVTDLVHDVYMKCCRVTIEFANRQEARAYLLRMASNLAIDHERVEGRREDIIDGMASVADGYDRRANSPEAFALAADKASQVEKVLAGLPKHTRQMFVLVRLYGMSHREVAEQMGVSKSLVDKYVLQALLRCRDTIGGLDKLD